jgi:hypothetical protein
LATVRENGTALFRMPERYLFQHAERLLFRHMKQQVCQQDT